MTEKLSSAIYMNCGEPSRATPDEYFVGVPQTVTEIEGEYNGNTVSLDIRSLLQELMDDNAGELTPEEVADEAANRGYI